MTHEVLQEPNYVLGLLASINAAFLVFLQFKYGNKM